LENGEQQMAETRQNRVVGLSNQLQSLQSELERAEQSVAVLRQARSVLYAEMAREEHGIALGDRVAWRGERRARGGRGSRPITLRGVVVDVPMQDRLLVHRVNSRGERMEQTVYVPVSEVTARPQV
jgi:hypothetical protein